MTKNQCHLCRTQTQELRPVCIANCEHVPLLCEECSMAMDSRGRVDWERDADRFGYSEDAILERVS